ncbi:hypothetical protein D3C81_1321030 [compost metagenome]
MVAGRFLFDDSVLVTRIPFQEVLSRLDIVVQRNNIGDRMLPAVIRNNRSVRIDRLGQMVDGFRKFLLSLIVPNGGNSPGLIKRHPGDNARMIILLVNDFQPFLGEIIHRIIMKFESCRHFRPYQDSFNVTPIQKAGIFDFHMLAHAVIAHFQHVVDIGNQRFLTRRS